MQREETLQQRQVNEHEALGLGGTDAIQDEYNLPPKLEEAIERGADLSEDVIVVDNEDEEVQGVNEPTHEEMVPD